ncbi:hypothetical protein MKW92_039276 [Papaver armeniacum]|nr:hypothetical protein MKW92_039276 [Papaver armeniacum]
MARPTVIVVFVVQLLLILGIVSCWKKEESGFSIIDVDDDQEEGLELEELFGRDYSPPSPPPPPPPTHPPSLSCERDLGGIGSFNTSCEVSQTVVLEKDSYIEGSGSFHILDGVELKCPKSGCAITINLTGNFSLGANSSIICGDLTVNSTNACFFNGSSLNTTSYAGKPPPQTSGTPQGIDGAGGGHGGRGAQCLTDDSKIPEDVWGGDTYSWTSLQAPDTYGSKGGSTSNEEDYGGGGGGKILMGIKQLIELNGTVLAEGGIGGLKGGGGSGGSIHIIAHRMSYGCPGNNGAAGTLYDAVPLDVYVRNNAKAVVPLLWSRVQVQGQLSLSSGVLVFGLRHFVYGALRMSVKVFLMLNSKMLIDGGADSLVATSLLEASNVVVLKESSVIHSNANLGVHGQGLLNLSGPGNQIEAQRLILSLFYSIHVGPGSVLQGPLQNATTSDMTPRLYCELEECPMELLHPPEDCNVNSSLTFTLQICRVEDITVEGLIRGSVVHFHRARNIVIQPAGTISASGLGMIPHCLGLYTEPHVYVPISDVASSNPLADQRTLNHYYFLFGASSILQICIYFQRVYLGVYAGCTGGLGRGTIQDGVGGGGGHGGKGGDGYANGTLSSGGATYGNPDLPCELGSGSGNNKSGSTAGGGIIVMGSMEHSLTTLSVYGSLRADGESFGQNIKTLGYANGSNGGPGGGSGGTLLLFLHSLTLGDTAVLSSIGGRGSQNGGGGGGGGRIHFDWADVLTGDEYMPLASVNGSIHTLGGLGFGQGHVGGNGTITGNACPKGLYGTFCKECPIGTFKNVSGSDKALCRECPPLDLPHRATYTSVRGGVAEAPCPYRCISDRYHTPYCYTALEELIYTFGGPWLFGLLLSGLLILLALVLSVARMKFVGTDDLPGPAPTQHGSQIDHSFPFLESLNEVLETNRAEESQSHVHRMYFLGPNTFGEPWHLPHSPPDEITEIVYEDAFNRFADEINALAAYQWWEGSVYTILSILAFPFAWSWQQWRRRIKLQRLREFVRSEYDHACLRSCRSRALYEGLKVAATSDLMLAYVDFFLGGDEKRSDLPPRLHQRFPMRLVFGGNGSYMAPFLLHSDNVLTSLMSQSFSSTIWYRLVAGLNAQLRLVRRGHLKRTFLPILNWLETHANPALSIHGVRVDLACFQPTSCGYCQFGLLVYAVEVGSEPTSIESVDSANRMDKNKSVQSIHNGRLPSHSSSENLVTHKGTYGGILDTCSLHLLNEKKDISYLCSFIVNNTKPVGHQDLVGLVISILLLADFSLVLLTLLQLYSISLLDFFLFLFVLPLSILSPFPAGINALFSHGPRRSAGLARVYALWNITSLTNVVVAFICEFVHYKTQSSSSKKSPNFQPWNFSMDESGWWMFPTGLVLCKCVQARLINWHVANLEIQDRSLYSDNPNLFWQP